MSLDTLTVYPHSTLDHVIPMLPFWKIQYRWKQLCLIRKLLLKNSNFRKDICFRNKIHVGQHHKSWIYPCDVLTNFNANGAYCEHRRRICFLTPKGLLRSFDFTCLFKNEFLFLKKDMVTKTKISTKAFPAVLTNWDADLL